MKLEKRGREREREREKKRDREREREREREGERLSYVSTFFDSARVWVCHVTGILIFGFCCLSSVVGGS